MATAAGEAMPQAPLWRRALGPLDVRLRAWRRWRRGEAELHLLPQLVDRRRNAVDVGANKGVYSVHLARLARHVFAYEPSPIVYPVMAQCGIRNLTLSPLALSDRAGSATFHVPLGKRGPSSQQASLQATQADRPGMTLTVPTGRLDDEGLTDVGFIKIDVEGHEQAVIAGATDLLARDRPVLLIEIEARHMEGPLEPALARIEDLGYAGYFYHQGCLQPVARLPQGMTLAAVRDGSVPFYVNNFIFLPQR